jgi:ribosomal subunit interface protein
MIKKFGISGVHMHADKKTDAYARSKIGGLDRYMPNHARASAHADIKLIEKKIKARTEYTCEAILFLPHGELVAKETGPTILAAIDAVEPKLKAQLQKYKSKHGSLRVHRRILRKLLQRKP